MPQSSEPAHPFTVTPLAGGAGHASSSTTPRPPDSQGYRDRVSGGRHHADRGSIARCARYGPRGRAPACRRARPPRSTRVAQPGSRVGASTCRRRAGSAPCGTPGHPVREARRGSAGTRSSRACSRSTGAILVGHRLGGAKRRDSSRAAGRSRPQEPFTRKKLTAASPNVRNDYRDVKYKSVVALWTSTLR